MSENRKIISKVIRHGDRHWVGDGFPVQTMFHYDTPGIDADPFLLLDYAGPMKFEPASQPRGVGKHPHRGFETVTIVYQGDVKHRDTAGNAGVIGPGDVQWMTAGRGLLHEEMHGDELTRHGGMFEAIQLWVNLPAKSKMIAPAYQSITDNNIPAVSIPQGAGTVRVIAGSYQDQKGPARTHTPIHLRDIQLHEECEIQFSLESGTNTILFVLQGRVRVNGQETISNAELLAFARGGETVLLSAERESRLLLMNGEPIDEPVVGHGPFVMNTREEINKAIEDFNEGLFD